MTRKRKQTKSTQNHKQTPITANQPCDKLILASRGLDPLETKSHWAFSSPSRREESLDRGPESFLLLLLGRLLPLLHPLRPVLPVRTTAPSSRRLALARRRARVGRRSRRLFRRQLARPPRVLDLLHPLPHPGRHLVARLLQPRPARVLRVPLGRRGLGRV
ncbi:hypothetical protein VTK73DRAFT_9644 [Phialemonium thermophilum]|uniref:Uncharacterized protein n=1 Tax=Phialemonium thermophilum TaxID=223376 RepID=A0ABR3W178_9PEZI